MKHLENIFVIQYLYFILNLGEKKILELEKYYKECDT